MTSRKQLQSIIDESTRTIAYHTELIEKYRRIIDEIDPTKVCVVCHGKKEVMAPAEIFNDPDVTIELPRIFGRVLEAFISADETGIHPETNEIICAWAYIKRMTCFTDVFIQKAERYVVSRVIEQFPDLHLSFKDGDDITDNAIGEIEWIDVDLANAVVLMVRYDVDLKYIHRVLLAEAPYLEMLKSR